MIAALAILAAVAFQPNDVLGRWETETKHGIVEITRCGDSICGHLRDSDGIRTNPQLRDVHNDNPDQRQRPVKDLLMIDGFRWNADEWAGGWIYNAEDGGTYKATVTQPDATHLRVQGCIVWPLCKSQTWTRVG